MHITGRAVLVWILRRSWSHSRLGPRSRFSKSRGLLLPWALQHVPSPSHHDTFSRCNTRCHFLGFTYALVSSRPPFNLESASDPVGQLGPLTRLFVGRCRKIWHRPTVTVVYNKADRRLAGGGGGLYQKHVRHRPRPRGKWAGYLRDNLQYFSILFTFHVRFVRELLIFFFWKLLFLNLENNFPSQKKYISKLI